MLSDRAQHLDPAGAASLPPPATHLPPPPPPSGGGQMRAEILAEFRRIGTEGFERGYSAAVDQLAEPITTRWLAGESGLPEERCRELLLELRGMLAKVADRG